MLRLYRLAFGTILPFSFGITLFSASFTLILSTFTCVTFFLVSFKGLLYGHKSKLRVTVVQVISLRITITCLVWVILSLFLQQARIIQVERENLYSPLTNQQFGVCLIITTILLLTNLLLVKHSIRITRLVALSVLLNGTTIFLGWLVYTVAIDTLWPLLRAILEQCLTVLKNGTIITSLVMLGLLCGFLYFTYRCYVYSLRFYAFLCVLRSLKVKEVNNYH